MSQPLVATGNFKTKGTFGTPNFELSFFDDAGKPLSPWHDLALFPKNDTKGVQTVNMVVEIPKGRMEKLEVNKELPHNPIKQDTKKGKPRYYSYGVPFFNYGMLPQTWENPKVKDKAGHAGDGDPLDVIEIGSEQLPTGSIVEVKVLGVLELIDQGEVDYKIIVVKSDDEMAEGLDTPKDIDEDIVARLVDWLKMYKTAEGKAKNKLTSDTISGPSTAMKVIRETHKYWKKQKFTATGQVAK